MALRQTAFPDGITRERSIDLSGRAHHPRYRRALLALVAVLPALALFGVFGQQPSTSVAVGPGASLRLSTPKALRGGVIFQTRVAVTARRHLSHPVIVLSRDWWESMTFNTITPDATQEQSRPDGGVALAYDALRAGERLTVWMQMQVNPTDVGHRHLNISVEDGRTVVARMKLNPQRLPIAMDLVVRAAVVFFFVFFLTRVVGKRELSTLEPFDLILLIVTGDLVQQGITQNDQSVTGALIVMSTIALLTVFVSWAAFRSRRVDRITGGEPLVLLQDGEVIERNLRRERLTREDLEEEARSQQVAHLGDLAWAILEKDGQISCIPRKQSAS